MRGEGGGAPRYVKPAILAEIPRDRHAVIEASAGTGKTFTLEHLVVDILLTTPARLEEVLVVTFTEKATAELRRRLRAKLVELLAHRGEAPGVADGAVWLLDGEARRKLEAALASLDAATLSTIHGFCQRVLAEQAFASGRLFGERQVDSREAFSTAFRDELRGRLAREPQLRELLRLWLGAGKDVEALEGLLHRCSIERGELQPHFEAERLVARVGECPLTDGLVAGVAAELKREKVHPATVASLVKKLGRVQAWCAERAGRADGAALLAELQALRDEASSDPVLDVVEKLPPAAGPLCARAHAWMRALHREAPSLAAAVVQAMLPGVRTRLAERKRTLGLVDFDDMLLVVRDALAGPGGEALAAALRARYRFALVDEFQDTDEVQWDVFRRAFFEGGESVLYLIGDPKQSIYGFRGADVQTYLAAREQVRASGGAVVALDTNFRSTRGVVDAVNAVLDQGAPSPFFDGAIDYRHPVKCGKGDFRAVGPDGEDATPVHLWHVAGEGKQVSADGVRRALGRRLADEVKALLSPAAPPLRLVKGDKPPERLRARDIFVLTRTEREGRELAEWLRGEGLPVAFFKQDGLFQSDEARDLRDVLAAVADPDDASARLAAWMGPFFALSLEELERARELPGTHPLVTQLHAWKALADARDYERLFTRLLEDSGVVRRELFLGASERRLTNTLHLMEVLLEEVNRSRASLPEVVALLKACIEERRQPPGESGNVQRLESEADAVQFMTLHKSKGLEAPVVFLLGGLSRGRSDEVHVLHKGGKRVAWVGPVDGEEALLVERESDEEAQRLLYVGLTRAAARLYLPLVSELTAEEAGELAKRGLRVPTGKASVEGPCRVLNPRLEALARGGTAEAARLFARELVWAREEAPPQAEEARLAAWEPPEELLAEPPPDFRAEVLRRSHGGFLVTSYSRMGGVKSLSREDDAREDRQADRDAEWPELPEGALPPGVATGLFLHEVLERADVSALKEGYEAWGAREEVQALFLEAAGRHGLGEEHLPEARRVAWAALRTPVPLPGGRLLPGVAGAARLLREVEFLFPIPEAGHPLLGGGTPGAVGAAGGREGRFSIERGCVRGFIDLVLEHEGRVYFADWKSDLLPRYDAASVTEHVRLHYALQEQLYTLAVVRLLGLKDAAAYEARFGGSLYLFLRGLPETEEGEVRGVYAARPSWADVVAWERALLANTDWGLARAG